MHIYNFKLNKSRLIKYILVLFVLICILILFFSFSQVFNNMKKYKENNFIVSDNVENANKTEIPSSQYTNTLKTVHEHLDEYIGKEISFVGYIYKIDYLKPNQFVIARNMIINNADQTVVVGFLCEYEKLSELENLSWVKITGHIKKGYLNGDIPIIEITNIQKTEKPSDEFVYPPEDTYIPTSNIY